MNMTSMPRRARRCAMAALSAGALLAAGAAWAQGASAASAPPSPAKLALVQKAVDLQLGGIDAFARVLLRESVAPMLNQANQLLGTQVPEDKRAATGKAMDEEVRKFFESSDAAMRDKTRGAAKSILPAMLDQRFDEGELRQLITWLESPVSKKYMQLQPEAQRALVQKVMTDMRPTLKPRADALEKALLQHLGLKMPGAGPQASGPAPAGK